MKKLLSSCDTLTLFSFGLCFFLFYSSLGFEMALVLSAFYLARGLGHLLGLAYCGIKSGGMRFMPPFGGYVDLAEDSKWRADEAFSCLGPSVAVLVSATLGFLVYLTTGNLTCLFFAIVSFGINFMALLPIVSFDGGWIVKSVAFSLSNSWGMAYMLASLLITPAFVYLNLSARGAVSETVMGLVFMAFADCAQKCFEEYRVSRAGSLVPMNSPQIKVVSLLYISLFLIFALTPWLLGISAISSAMQVSVSRAIVVGLFGLIFSDLLR